LQTLFIIFLVAIAVQGIYFTCFLAALLKKSTNIRAEPQPMSVIVCAHDEEQNLKELIPLLLNQQHPEFEVIIVNDRSNDGTYDFLLEETPKHDRLRMVQVATTPDHVNGKKYAITLGIKAARYDWILLTDADCRPYSEFWIQSFSEQCASEKEIVLGYSPYQKEKGFLNLFIRYETLFAALQYISYAILKNPYMGVGRNLAYRKSFFLRNKGFNEFLGITGGDDDLFVNQHANGSNSSICVGEKALVYSIPKKTWKDFFHQKVRHLTVGKQYRLRHRIVLGLFSISHSVTWLAGIPLVFFFSGSGWVLAVLLTRSLLVTVTIHQAARRLGHKFELWSVLLLDFLFVIYYLSTAPVALVTKKLRWRN
jgi:glycosyltransferase involved in cell wall biosynthesis